MIDGKKGKWILFDLILCARVDKNYPVKLVTRVLKPNLPESMQEDEKDFS